MANEDTYTLGGSVTNAYYQTSLSNGNETVIVGSDVAGGRNSCDGAVRFSSIPVAGGTSVNFVQLRLYTTDQGSGTMHLETRGIKETNTSAFSSNPFGRTRTTAAQNSSHGMPGVGAYIGINVLDEFNEIKGQGGWASGNAMGFVVANNGSDSNAYIRDFDSLAAQLLIRVNAEPNFTPSPQTLIPKPLPATSKYGIVVSKQGIDVRKATEHQLNFNHRKKFLKIIAQGEVETTSGVLKQIPHGFGFTPLVVGWAKGNNFRFKLNRFLGGAADPVGGGVEGFIGATSTTIEILTTPGAKVYYYVISDRLA